METIKPDEKIVVTAALTRTTPKGPVPARADGDLVWTADKPGVVGLFPLNNGLTCEITNIGPGTCVVTCTADADLSAAVRNLTATLDITCIEGEADSLVLTAGPSQPL